MKCKGSFNTSIFTAGLLAASSLIAAEVVDGGNITGRISPKGSQPIHYSNSASTSRAMPNVIDMPRRSGSSSYRGADNEDNQNVGTTRIIAPRSLKTDTIQVQNMNMHVDRMKMQPANVPVQSQATMVAPAPMYAAPAQQAPAYNQVPVAQAPQYAPNAPAPRYAPASNTPVYRNAPVAPDSRMAPPRGSEVRRDAINGTVEKRRNDDGYGPGEVVGDDPIIPNAPILAPTKVIEVTAVGMGVAPENTISPAQALALAKRAAIVDAYRQIGEKMYGIRINGKETVKDMILRDSTIKTKVMAVIKNAEITETVYKDGLAQVSMELKLDGRRWYRVLTGRNF